MGGRVMTMIALSDIQDDGTTQMRVEMKPNVVRDYPTQLDHYHAWQRR